MKRITWLACGFLLSTGLIASACGNDNNGDGDGDASGGASSGGASSPSGGASSGGASSGGNSSSSGGMGGDMGGGGMGGSLEIPEDPPDCDEIESLAFGDDDSFEVSSPDFDFCTPMPIETTCEDKPFPESISPEINWTDGPQGTMSYAVVFKDLSIIETSTPGEMRRNQAFHWVAWDIPSDTLGIPADMMSGFESSDILGALQWAPFNDYGFMGPCPNLPSVQGMEPPPLNNDSYSFVVYALPTETIDIPALEAGVSWVRTMDDYLKSVALAAAEYRGTSNAQASEILEGTFPAMWDVPCPSDGVQPDDCLSRD